MIFDGTLKTQVATPWVCQTATANSDAGHVFRVVLEPYFDMG
jgi:hypothetical protein